MSSPRGETHAPPLYLALVHHPVRTVDGEETTTAVTNLDVHDMARLCATYGLKRCFVVTPVHAQQALVQRILDHWTLGPGAKRIPDRAVALGRVHVVESISAMEEAIQEECGARAKTITTAARSSAGTTPLSFTECHRILQRSSTTTPWVLMFGTGHGLADSVIQRSECLLEPIAGKGTYNHLSVRMAAAIVVDRLMGLP